MNRTTRAPTGARASLIRRKAAGRMARNKSQEMQQPREAIP